MVHHQGDILLRQAIKAASFGKPRTSVADIGRLRPDGADRFLKVRAVDAALGTKAAFISRLVGTTVPAESLRLTGGTEPAGVVGKALPPAKADVTIRILEF